MLDSHVDSHVDSHADLDLLVNNDEQEVDIVCFNVQQLMMRNLLVLCVLEIVLSKLTNIAIIGTNDIHGGAFPTRLTRLDTSQTYNYGGLQFMGGIMDIIAKEYPTRSLYLDAGDQVQGGIQASKLVSSGEIINDFFQALGLNGSTIGNHEFDFGPQFLEKYLKSKNSNTLVSNLEITSESNGNNLNVKPSALYELEDGIKIGVIGLATLETVKSTVGFVKNLFPNFHIHEYRDIVLQESRALRAKGANAVLLLAHAGNQCYADEKYGRWTVESVQRPCKQDQITQLIKHLPKGTLDGIVQGHKHRFAHHFIEGVPVMGTINGGYYFNVLYLKFEDGKLIQSEIEGPIPACEKVFKNLNTCKHLSQQELKLAGELVEWTFHQKPVRSHPIVKYLFKTKWQSKMDPFLENLNTLQMELTPSRIQESELANLFTSMMQKTDKVDFALINTGSFRTTWEPSNLQYRHFYNMLPFDGTLVSFQINGKELIDLLSIIQAGSKGFYHSSGLRQVVLEGPKRKLLDVKWFNGTQIDPKQNYRGITLDFLLKGGDDFSLALKQAYTPRNMKVVGQIRSILKDQLVKWGPIKKNTLIDPHNPRLIVVHSERELSAHLDIHTNKKEETKSVARKVLKLRREDNKSSEKVQNYINN